MFGASSGFAVVFGKAIGFVALVQKDWVVTCCDKGFHKGSMKVLTGLGFRVYIFLIWLNRTLFTNIFQRP